MMADSIDREWRKVVELQRTIQILVLSVLELMRDQHAWSFSIEREGERITVTREVITRQRDDSNA